MRRRFSKSEWARRPSSHIPYSLDTELFSPGASTQTRKPTILFVGHMYSDQDHRKGLPVLLSAIPAIRDRVPDAELIIAGQVVTSGTLPEGVKVLGSIDRERLVELYRESAVYCLPTLGDNSPVTLQEAMACGAAVVATRVGGLPELVEDKRTGLLVTADDSKALVEPIVRLLEDEELRSRLGAAAREKIIDHCSRQRAAERHFQLWTALSRSE